MKSILIRSVLAVAVASSLPACAPLMVGGMVGGAMVATDRRTSGIQLEDEAIELKASNRLRETLGGRAHLNVTSYNRQVLISGEVALRRTEITPPVWWARSKTFARSSTRRWWGPTPA